MRLVPLKSRDNLVRDMIDQRVGAVTVLFDAGHRQLHKRRHVIGGTGHADIGSYEVDVEVRPWCVADVCGDRQPNASGDDRDRTRESDLETEPVADVASHGFAKMRLSRSWCAFQIQVDVESAARTDLTGEQGRRTFDDPRIVEGIQAFQEAVVGRLPLQLRHRPRSVCGEHFESIREGSSKGKRRCVNHTAHRLPPSLADRFVASFSHPGVCGSPTCSYIRRSTAKPSPIGMPRLRACGASAAAKFAG